MKVSVKLYQSEPHTCGYYRDRIATNIIIDPEEPALPHLYQGLLANGFRRAGGIVYRPKCNNCQACIPTRIAIAEFIENRQQRRTLGKNTDVQATMVAAEFAADRSSVDEKLDLYSRYIASRHRDGGMDNPTEADFRRFLLSEWATVNMLELRLDRKLIACAVTDATTEAASAVYTFYDPAMEARSLGVLSVLKQIEYCRQAQITHLYLGYWIQGHPKMDYKRVFKPLQYYMHGIWSSNSSMDAD